MQIGLSLKIDARRCLSHPAALSSYLHQTPEELQADIERGTVHFAFDLRAPSADRACVRLWHPNVLALVASQGADPGPVMPLAEMLLQLVPGLFDVRSSDLERYWSISHQHVHELIAAECLPVSRRGAATGGPNSCHFLSSSGLRAFLRSRVMCAAHATVAAP